MSDSSSELLCDLCGSYLEWRAAVSFYRFRLAPCVEKRCLLHSFDNEQHIHQANWMEISLEEYLIAKVLYE